MIKLSTKKLAGVILGLVVIGSGVAYAYWTAGGTGSGTVTSGDVQPVTVVQTAATGVAPGVPKTLSGTFTNPNQGPVYVTDLTGHKIESKSRQKKIHDALLAVFQGVDEKAGKVAHG